MKQNDQEFIFISKGLVEAIICTDVTFYLTYFDEALQGFVAAYELVMQELEPHIKWYLAGSMTHPSEFSNRARKAFTNWFSKLATKRESYELTLHSGNDSEEVGPWGFDFLIGPYDLKESAGYFRFGLPVEMLLNGGEMFLKLVRKIVNVLPFRSGHAGYGLQFDAGSVIFQRDQHIKAWCKRYVGIDCRDLPATSLYMNKHIKSVNWLTMLDYDFVEQLGGIEYVRRMLGEDILVEELKHGIIIQAGFQPHLGDVNRGEDMSLYIRVNDLLRPLRTPEQLPFNGFDRDETQEWLERFDNYGTTS